MARVSKLLDVSVLLRPGMPTYPGNPEFDISPVKRIAQGASSNVSGLTLGTHTGTHVDAPRHFFDDKPGVDALPLDLLMGRARVVDLPHRGGITEAHLAAAGLREDLCSRALWGAGGRRPCAQLWARRGARCSDSSSPRA